MTRLRLTRQRPPTRITPAIDACRTADTRTRRPRLAAVLDTSHTRAHACSSFLRGDAPETLCPNGQLTAGHYDVISTRRTTGAPVFGEIHREVR
jgi:hypothetical protein